MTAMLSKTLNFVPVYGAYKEYAQEKREDKRKEKFLKKVLASQKKAFKTQSLKAARRNRTVSPEGVMFTEKSLQRFRQNRQIKEIKFGIRVGGESASLIISGGTGYLVKAATSSATGAIKGYLAHERGDDLNSIIRNALLTSTSVASNATEVGRTLKDHLKNVTLSMLLEGISLIR